MEKYSFKIKNPEFFNFESLVMSHGWKELSPFEYHNEKRLLYFAAYIYDEPVDIWLNGEDGFIGCDYATFKKTGSDFKDRVKEVVARVISLERKTDSLIEKSKKAGPEYENLVKKGWNRILRSSTLFEDFCKVLFTTNCSWALTKKISSSICSGEFSDKTPGGRYPFPKPERISCYSKEELKAMIPVGYRNESLKLLSDKFKEYGNSWIEGRGADESFDLALSLKGFGHYAASHMMIILDFFKEIPTDSVVVNYLKEHHGVDKKDCASFMKEHYKEWGDDFWWGFKLESVLKYLKSP